MSVTDWPGDGGNQAPTVVPASTEFALYTDKFYLYGTPSVAGHPIHWMEYRYESLNQFRNQHRKYHRSRRIAVTNRVISRHIFCTPPIPPGAESANGCRVGGCAVPARCRAVCPGSILFSNTIKAGSTADKALVRITRPQYARLTGATYPRGRRACKAVASGYIESSIARSRGDRPRNATSPASQAGHSRIQTDLPETTTCAPARARGCTRKEIAEPDRASREFSQPLGRRQIPLDGFRPQAVTATSESAQ